MLLGSPNTLSGTGVPMAAIVRQSKSSGTFNKSYINLGHPCQQGRSARLEKFKSLISGLCVYFSNHAELALVLLRRIDMKPSETAAVASGRLSMWT